MKTREELLSFLSLRVQVQCVGSKQRGTVVAVRARAGEGERDFPGEYWVDLDTGYTMLNSAPEFDIYEWKEPADGLLAN